MKSTVSFVSDYFHLSDEDSQEKIKSGRATKVYDRVQWTMTYLRAAGLIISPKRGRYLITDKGREILNSGISELSQKDLCDISPDFEAFLKGKKSLTSDTPINSESDNS